MSDLIMSNLYDYNILRAYNSGSYTSNSILDNMKRTIKYAKTIPIIRPKAIALTDKEKRLKDLHLQEDEFFDDAVSDCCEAPVMIGSLCAECRDRCQIIELEEGETVL